MIKRIINLIIMFLFAVLLLASGDNRNTYNYNLSPVEIIVPKNQALGQMLSIVVTDNNGNLVVFDGGRVEDADYLCKIIKEKGGVVKTWFLTHIHDDHLGALYQILSDKRTDIKIEKIVFEFADYSWYLDKVGEEAGVMLLFLNALNEYNKYALNNNYRTIEYININSDADMHYAYNYKNKKTGEDKVSFTVDALNHVYKCSSSYINNSSIAYYVNINNKKGMIIFGDLESEGGKRLFADIDKMSNKSQIYNSSILVLSHHGQRGLDVNYYKRFNPNIVIWPTSKDIYENSHGRYTTDDTKDVLKSIKSIKKEILSYAGTTVIK